MKPIPCTDAELITRIKSGEKKAFDLVYEKHWLRIFRVAYRITEVQAIAQDIVQDTFISFWEKGCHNNILNIEAYLYQAVKFRCFMHLRSGSIRKKHLDHFAAILSSNAPKEDEYNLKELEEVLEKSIALLPEKCREVYVLSRVEELPNKLIAEKLHISPKTVENQITKALKHLRLSLDKFALFLLAILY